MQRKAIVIGATGLVGQHLVKQLSELYDTLIVIARRPPRYINASMRFFQVSDFDNLAEIFASVGVDSKTDAFSCLGTTKKQAGSDEAFRKVDHDYNVNFATLCRERRGKLLFIVLNECRYRQPFFIQSGQSGNRAVYYGARFYPVGDFSAIVITWQA